MVGQDKDGVDCTVVDNHCYCSPDYCMLGCSPGYICCHNLDYILGFDCSYILDWGYIAVANCSPNNNHLNSIR